MFTGLVEALGHVEAISPTPDGKRLRIASPELGPELALGDSIAVDGVCLTAVSSGDWGFEADVVPETLRRTDLGSLETGDTINLERPLRPDDRLGGHFVQGHVDATGTVRSARKLQDGRELAVSFALSYDHLVVEKGSVAINGVSLTVARRSRGCLWVALIPHTCTVTNLGRLEPGDLVNLEFDYLAKLVVSWLERGRRRRRAGALAGLR